MKYLDIVEIIADKPEYAQSGVKKGMRGMLTDAEIRGTQIMVVFSHSYFEDKEDVYIPVFVGDLSVAKDAGATDEQILADLPGHDPHWWCKVENGYIINLLGDRKNKIAYDYDS